MASISLFQLLCRTKLYVSEGRSELSKVGLILEKNGQKQVKKEAQIRDRDGYFEN